MNELNSFYDLFFDCLASFDSSLILVNYKLLIKYLNRYKKLSIPGKKLNSIKAAINLQIIKDCQF